MINAGNTTNSSQTSVDPGQITIGWEDSGTLATASPPVTILLSSLVKPGDTYGFSGSTGIIQPGTSTNAPGNWGTAVIYPAGNSPTNAADPTSIATLTSADNFSTDVNGDGANDIVVSDEYPSQGTGDIGVLENSGTGTFPTTSIYAAGTTPDSVALATLFSHNNSTTPVLDAAVANAAGGVTTMENGLPPTDVQGQFLRQFEYTYPNASVTTAVAVINVSNSGSASSGNDLVTLDPGTNTVTVLNSSTGAIVAQFTAANGLVNPIAVAVGDFGGSSAPDIAVLNAGTGNNDSSIKVFLNTSTTSVSFNTSVPAIQLNANAVSMASGDLTNNPTLLDLAVVTENANTGSNELVVLQNTATPGGSSVSFTQIVVAGSTFQPAFAGTPVMGQQGIAIGDLSNSGNHAGYQDIAVVYAAAGTLESMVAVFRNLDDPIFHAFQRTQNGGNDFDAGQTNPTAIALSFLTNTPTNVTKTPWEDIIVTNNDNDDTRDPSPYAGTISVLAVATSPTVTTQVSSAFTDPVAVPNPGAVDNLTVTVELTDEQSVANLSLILIGPDGSEITLVQNQLNSAGKANTGVGLTGGNAIGVFGFTTGTPGSPGIGVGTIFDDNATRNIFDPTTTGTNGNSIGVGLQRLLPARGGATTHLPN